MQAFTLILRSAIFYLGYYLSVIVISLLCVSIALLFPKPRRHAFYAAWCRFILFWFSFACRVRYEISGLENIPDYPVVILANHQSEWETILLYHLLAPVCPILKKELLSIPFWGWAMRLQQPIAIDRSRRHRSGKEILTQGVDRIGKGMSVVIFPEGTRMSVDLERKFSRGGAKLAMAAKVPILPVAHNAGHCWPPRRFLKYPGVIQVIIGPLYSTNNADASQLTQQVEVWVRQHLVAWQKPA